MDRALPPKKSYPKSFVILFLTFVFSVFLYISLVPVTIAERDVLDGSISNSQWKRTVISQGKVIPKNNIVVSSYSSGVISNLVSDVGKKVKKGQTLLSLENRDIVDSLELSRLELSQEKSKLDTMLVNHKLDVINIEGDIKVSQAELDTLLLEVEARRKLAQSGIISELDLRRILGRMEEAQTRLDVNQQKLSARSKLYQIEVSSQKVVIDKLSLQIEKLEQKKESLIIRSPIDGVVTELIDVVGQKVGDGDKIANITDVDNLKVQVKVPQNDVKYLSIGQSVLLSSSSGKIIGSINKIEPMVTNGTIDVDVYIAGKTPNWFRPNLALKSEFSISTENMLQISLKLPPHNSIWLYKKNHDTDYGRVKVNTGESNDSATQLLSSHLANIEKLIFVPNLSEASDPPKTIKIQKEG